MSIEKSHYLRRLGRALPALFAVLVLIAVALVLGHELGATSLDDITAELQSLSWRQLGLALFFTCLSYYLLTHYDRLALAYVGHQVEPWEMRVISFTAFAIGNNLGVSAISGGSVRLRAYSLIGISAIDVGKIVAFCALTFTLGAALLLGIALVIEPAQALEPLRFPVGLLRTLGGLLIAVTLVYLATARSLNTQLLFGSWRFALPGFRIAVQQVLVASLDLMSAAAVLYVLLPAGHDVSYPVLLGAYVIAICLGLVSSLPGGIGVFEGMMLLLLPTFPTAELLAAVLVYRLIYYLLPLSVAAGILVTRELRLQIKGVTSSLVRGRDWASGTAPRLSGLVVLLAGIVLMVSGSLPGETSRLHFLVEIFPLPLLETSHLLNSAIGVGLLIVARGLFARLRSAYRLALALLLGGALVSLGKGLDYEEALTLVIAAGVLWFCRAEFYRRSSMDDLGFPFAWMLSIGAVVGAALWIGFFSFRQVEYQNALWWRFAFDADAPRMLRSVLVASLVAVTFGLYRLLRSSPPLYEQVSESDWAAIRRIVSASPSSLAKVALLGDKRFLLHPSREAFIMYQVSDDSWIALGDPVGDVACFEDLVWQFREQSSEQGDRCAFYEVSSEYLPLYVDTGLTLSKLGEEARVPLQEFTLEGSKWAELRQTRRRVLREGGSFEIVAAAEVRTLLPGLQQVSDAWLSKKRAAEKGFSLGTFNVDYLSHFDIALIRVGGEIVAFANIWTGAGKAELSIDLMRYSNRAPDKVMDFLLTELMLWGRAAGYRSFLLGMAPLSGMETHPLATLWQQIGHRVFRHGENFYSFESVRHYKEKFNPVWESRYLASPGGLELPRVLIDATLLVSGGLRAVL
ncbi:MAG: bifunctional lysylphosphatidylglycerol flippase/synthetase MprF [Pseudomonadota bacterium]